MIAHKTFTEHGVIATDLQEKQSNVRDAVARFVNENKDVAAVLDISEVVIPDEGVFTVTVWYRLRDVAPIEERTLRPEELSAELLDRVVHAPKPQNSFDIFADKSMVHSTSM